MNFKFYALVVLALQFSNLANAQIDLLKDINPGKYVSGPAEGGIVYHGQMYYMGAHEITGYELWRTDGTVDGSTLFKDINPGAGNSLPHQFTILNDILYFAASTASGRELWRTDGTTEGTYLVKDINEGSADSDPRNLVVVNDKLFFRATTAVAGRELWVTDGTPAGTSLVYDANPGTASSNYSWDRDIYKGESIAGFNGNAYFYADDGSPGAELWKTDGTAAGTVLVKDMHDTYADAAIMFLVSVNSHLVIGALRDHRVQLWTSDGTSPGTVTVGNIGVWGAGNQFPTSRDILNNYLYFGAVDGDSYNDELWRTDGTTANTQQVAEISSDPEVGSSVMNLEVTGGEVYFAARSNNDPASGKLGLFKSNGSIGNLTAIDTTFVSGFSPGRMTMYNGLLAFEGAKDYTIYDQFFTYDGSTVKSYNLPVDPGNYLPNFFVELNGKLLFNASGLMQFDGTTPTRIGTGTRSSSPSIFTDAGGGITYFAADNGITGAELWKTDGTYNGTTMVKDINPSAGSKLAQFKMFNGKLYFTADDGTHGIELWKSDGTEAGTVLVSDMFPGINGSNPNTLTVSGNTLYFAAQGTQSGLWKVVGEGLPEFVKSVTVSPGSMASNGAYLFFSAYDATLNKCALFKTDGTQAGTLVVSDNISTCFGPSQNTSELAVMNGKVYFSGMSPNFESELWVYDGSTTAPVRAYAQGGPGQPSNYLVVGNTLYFGASDVTHGYELWKTDGTAANTLIVKDIKAGMGTSLWTPPQHGPPFPPSFARASFNGQIYFTADDGAHGFELWTSDGTDAGTFMVNDLAPGSSSGNPSLYNVLDSSLYFLTVSKVYVTNGQACGTREISSTTYITTTAQNLAVSGSKLFVSLKDQSFGQEPFTIDPSQIPPPPPGCGPPQPDPITQPTALTFSTVTDNSIGLSFTPSTTPGAGYITLMRAYGSPHPQDAPIDGTTYQVGSVIGSSTIVVGMGTQTSFSVTYLNPSTTYYFDVYAYDANHDYLTINPLAGSQATNEEGSAPPTSLTFSDVTDNSMTVSFTASDPAPDGYITVMKAFSSPHPMDIPQNGTTYQVGNVIGSSTIVVGVGTTTSLDIIYLNADTEYFFDVYPYSVSGGSYTYTTTDPLAGSQRTTRSLAPTSFTENQSNAYPNPFTDALTIPFETKNDKTPVRIVIYDQLGRMIADVVNTTYDAGTHEVKWDRTDTQGNKVQQGLYVIKASHGGKVKQGMVVAK
jgi:ELWxxDGT repeat protein